MESKWLAIAIITSTALLFAWNVIEQTTEESSQIPLQKHSYRGPLIASKYSDVFHRADCPHAQRIKLENIVYFETVEEAEAAGYRACMVCRPG
ncbi:hypothetical protein K8R43_02375 [archaeon]|nr:hypothetical protein [archaeon]